LDDINFLEAKALLHLLLAFRDHIRDSRVEVYTDVTTKLTHEASSVASPLFTSANSGFSRN